MSVLCDNILILSGDFFLDTAAAHLYPGSNKQVQLPAVYRLTSHQH